VRSRLEQGSLSSVEFEENQVHIIERIVGDVAMVEVVGDIIANSRDASLTDKIRSLRQQGYTRVLVDLGHVRYMDSSGLGELVHAYATTKKAGGALKLLRVTKRLRDLLAITKLVTVFETYDDEPSALASFAAAA
jgi:anti-sigma B factor antagonist